MRIVCLDYDESYNTFPELFETIIEKSHELGYTVILATMRFEHESDNILEKLSERIPVYFTGRRGKMNFLRDLGINPDIWIDDAPHWIMNDSIVS